jgi:hypothetical protein
MAATLLLLARVDQHSRHSGTRRGPGPGTGELEAAPFERLCPAMTNHLVIPEAAARGCPESILPIVVMDSLMCNCTSKLAPSARPGMTQTPRFRRIVTRGFDPRTILSKKHSSKV